MEKYASKPANSGGIRMSDGDWVCSDFDCGNVNFSRRTSCNRCGKERAELKLKKQMGTEIGKSAADKSRGLFSADDWQCNKCANVNWARRLTCNVCNAPKFGEVEARTGYGGGYNERGTIEYRPRRDSDDDEYDEFGRRKKKKNKEMPDKVMSLQRVQTGSLPHHHIYNTHKQSPAIVIEDPRIPKVSGHSSDNRSAEYLRESRYSRSSENSGEMVKKHPTSAMVGSRPSISRRESDVSVEVCGRGAHNSPRDCIMENRVSSTNDIRYKFTGKTLHDNFEVVYTLEERVCAAVWALAYMNCRMSAEQFQNTFDKPAPDFKTIFAWRQRLILTGCLVDKHNDIVPSPQGSSVKESIRMRRKLGRQKRARYYEQRGETTESSSDDRSNDFKRKIASKSNKSDNKIPLEISSDGDGQTGKAASEESETNSESKDTQSVEKKDSSNKYDTDPNRSVTPELTNVRMDLANIVKSPIRNAHDDKIFAEDNYFDEEPSKTKSYEHVSVESQFLVPEVPKSKKSLEIAQSIEESLKNGLEDIVSESERYSTDDGTDIDINTKLSPNNKREHKTSPYQSLGHNRTDLKYQPSTGASKSRIIDLPLPKFAEQTNFTETTLQGCSKNMSSAMRRIYESLASQVKGSDGDSGLEYVPTKINPDMAKRNHQLFSYDMTGENGQDIFSDNSLSISLCDGHTGGIPALSNSSLVEEAFEKKSTNTFKIEMFEDYVPDDDALYRDASNEELSDKDDVTPPDPPSISLLETKQYCTVPESIANIALPMDPPKVIEKKKNVEVTCESVEKTQVEVTQALDKSTEQTKQKDESINVVNPLASLLNIDLSNINAEMLSKALQDIQTLATSAQDKSEKVIEEDNKTTCTDGGDVNKDDTIVLDDSDEPKAPNIPFLSDMFDPGTPPGENGDAPNTTANVTDKVTDLSNIQETNLDDLLNLPPVRPIGGFKSFAIPKPVMLSRLKIPIPSGDQNKHHTKLKRKKKKAKQDGGGEVEEEREEEEEESGDEGDLSKYDLWGDDDTLTKGDKEAKSSNDGTNADNNDKPITEGAPPSPSTDDKRSRCSKKSSGSSRSSSSSSSSSDSSSGPAPRNRYDDFNLNSEQSRAESADSSRSRSNSRERKHSRSDRKHRKPTAEHKRDRYDRHSRPTHHSARDKHRKETDRRHHDSHRHRR